MALDENGNVRSSGWGKALGDIAGVIAGNPKADAEAENFRNVSEGNKIKLEEARRAAEREKALDPHRKGLADLFTEKEEFDPAGGEEIGPDGSRPKTIRKRAAFHWNGNKFEFDQDAVSKLVEHGVAINGVDFAKNWHAFLTRAAPVNAHVDPTYQGEASIGGLGAVPGGSRMSPGQVKNLEEDTIAKSIAAAKGIAATGDVKNPDGSITHAAHSPTTLINDANTPSITNDAAGMAALAKLPKGAKFRGPDGKIRIKQ